MATWFVYVDAEYYAETHIIEAATTEDAARLAREKTDGATYSRYEDEGEDGHAVPACAVMPLDDVVFVGSENRVSALREIREGA